MARIIILSLFYFYSSLLKGQNNDFDPTKFDYKKADSVALNIQNVKYKDYTGLAYYLTKDLQTEHEKLRVIFRWITNNIEYRDGSRFDDPNKIAKGKKAVCIGYSILLSKMCESVGIECPVISGFSKVDITQISMKLKKTDHAWNAVKFYDKWYLLDATWASSYYDIKKRKNVKEFNDFFFLTKPEYFIKTHLPLEQKWQFLDKPITKREFRKSYLYYKSYFYNNIKIIKPKNGFIKIHQKDLLELKCYTNTEIYNAIIDFGNDKIVYNPIIEKKDGYYLIVQKFDRKGIYPLYLFLKYNAVAAYKIRIK